MATPAAYACCKTTCSETELATFAPPTCNLLQLLVRYHMQQLTPHDPTFFWNCQGPHGSYMTFSAPTDNVSNPAANILRRTPFPAAWCPWVPPTGVDTALSSMSWQHHFLARKFGKNSRENVTNYRCPFWPHTEAI